MLSIPSNEYSKEQEGNYIIYKIDVGESKKRKKLLSNLHESFSSYICMTLQSKKNVSIQTINCAVTNQEIQNIFCPGTDSRVQQKEISIPKQVITFHYPDLHNNNNNKSDGNGNDDINNNGRLFPLYEDNPVGIQLYHAYLSGYNKTKLLRVKRITPEIPKVQPVVGSAEWIAQRQKESQQNQEEQDLLPDDVLIVNATTPSITWKIYNPSSKTFISTIMPRFSVPGVVIYSGDRALFGTAHNCLALGAAGNLVRCEGVTLFPPGCSWLSLALACVGIDSFQFMVNRSFPSNEKIELSKLNLVDEITDILTDSRNGWVSYNPTLVSLLQELFSDWTD